MWSVPPRNLHFMGRTKILTGLRTDLRTSKKHVRVLHGMGGIGKTQLAVEYAWRFAGDYDLVWWIDADNSETLTAQFAELASDLVSRLAPDVSVRRQPPLLVACLWSEIRVGRQAGTEFHGLARTPKGQSRPVTSARRLRGPVAAARPKPISGRC
jgi:hypothetical protein